LDIPTFLSTDAVANTFVRATVGEFSFLMPAMICILIIGSLNGTIFVSSRFLHAAARGGFLPTFISCTNPETDSPRAALVLNLLLVFCMTFTANVRSLINYIGFAQWSQRGITMVVLFWIRYRQYTKHDERVIRAPLIIPILFFLICFALTLTTLIKETSCAIVSIVVLIATFVVYMFFIYEKSLPSVHLYQKVSRKVDYFFTAICQVILNTMPQRIAMMQGAPTKASIVHTHIPTVQTTRSTNISRDSLTKRNVTSKVAPVS